MILTPSSPALDVLNSRPQQRLEQGRMNTFWIDLHELIRLFIDLAILYGKENLAAFSGPLRPTSQTHGQERRGPRVGAVVYGPRARTTPRSSLRSRCSRWRCHRRYTRTRRRDLEPAIEKRTNHRGLMRNTKTTSNRSSTIPTGP